MDLAIELKNYLDSTGRLKMYPSKRKYKILSLIYLSTKFEKGITYSEKEVNEILDNAHTFNDSCLLRRELFNKHFLGRLNDGSKYWMEDIQPTLSDFKID